MNRGRSAGFALWVMLSWCLLPQVGWGWGKDGHAIVGKIAELRLSPAALTSLQELTDRPLSSYEISSWPDTIAHLPGYAKIYPHNSFWHFVDIPFDADEYDPEREAAALAKRLKTTVEQIGTKNNVVEQIDIWRKVLADPKQRTSRRYTALRFIVHFLSDIHQPLHCTTRDDVGGNTVPVIYLGIYDKHVHLHQVWDDNLVTAARGSLQPLDYANQLHQKVTAKEQAAWEAVVEPKAWAKESHQLAKDVAYPPVLEQKWDADNPVHLDMAYVQKATPVVERQLMTAGVRLAKVLNEALAP